MSIAYGYYGVRSSQPNVKGRLMINDTVLTNNSGFNESVRASYFLSRMLESIDSSQVGMVIFNFADGSNTTVTYET